MVEPPEDSEDGPADDTAEFGVLGEEVPEGEEFGMDVHGCVGDNDRSRVAIGEMSAPVGLSVGDSGTVKGSLQYPKDSLGDAGLMSGETGLEDPSEELERSLVFTEKDIITGSKLQFFGLCSNLQL